MRTAQHFDAVDKELGVRAQLLDRRVTVNLTAFDPTYKNLKAQSIETLADGSTNVRLTSVGRLRSRGVEFEGSARMGSDLNPTGSATYLDATYTSFPVAQCYPLQTAGDLAARFLSRWQRAAQLQLLRACPQTCCSAFSNELFSPGARARSG